MTDKDLKTLKKSELLELLLMLRRELDEANNENDRLRIELEHEKRERNNEMMQLLRSTSDKVDVFCEWLFTEDGKEE